MLFQCRQTVCCIWPAIQPMPCNASPCCCRAIRSAPEASQTGCASHAPQPPQQQRPAQQQQQHRRPGPRQRQHPQHARRCSRSSSAQQHPPRSGSASAHKDSTRSHSPRPGTHAQLGNAHARTSPHRHPPDGTGSTPHPRRPPGTHQASRCTARQSTQHAAQAADPASPACAQQPNGSRTSSHSDPAAHHQHRSPHRSAAAVRGRRRSSDSRSDLAGLNAASSRDGDASGFHDALTGATGAPECR